MCVNMSDVVAAVGAAYGQKGQMPHGEFSEQFKSENSASPSSTRAHGAGEMIELDQLQMTTKGSFGRPFCFVWCLRRTRI